MQVKKGKRILMLGWEFPPFISGGLGTACYGLTKALSQCDTEVIFVLPKAVDTEYASHVKLLSPQAAKAAYGDRTPESMANTYQVNADKVENLTGTLHTTTTPPPPTTHYPPTTDAAFKHVTFKTVPSRLVSPYLSTVSTGHPPHPTFHTIPMGNDTSLGYQTPSTQSVLHRGPMQPGPINHTINTTPQHHNTHTHDASNYQGDLIAEAQRYADLCVDLADDETFDIIHAHDWLTFPAGLAVAAHTGKPLVVHVHSTEFDRSGTHIHSSIYDIERRGMHGALRVIAVSHLTRSVIEHRYGVEPDKIDVVYNGIEPAHHDSSLSHNKGANQGHSHAHHALSSTAQTTIHPEKIASTDKIVLFLGRITTQKGPEYFVQAAKKVLEKYDKVKFVMAGSGDRITDIIELAAEQNIGHKILFTGFLKGQDVERVFKMADVYVMPSVSEPFGIAPLEAISHDVPVIISKQSGVSEVLNHALKVDFWDTREMANKIIAVLKHPPLSSTLREHADMEVRTLTWRGAAGRCLTIYDHACEALAE